MTIFLYFILYTLYFILFPQPISAHAFGTLYTLPLPVWLYFYGGGAAVIISFLVIGFFATESGKESAVIGKYLFRIPGSLRFLAKIISLILFFLVILSGFLGSQSPMENFNTNFFWIIFYLGFSYLCILIGNIWPAVNPWKIMAEFFGDLKPVFTYPKKLSYWPALICYFLLIWGELLSGGLAVRPKILSILILFYSSLTFSGAYIFGKDWFKYGEFFSVFFNLISKVSPLEYKDGKVFLRIPFSELQQQTALHFSQLFFILFMLSSTAFDGFHSTTVWIKFYLGLVKTFGDISTMLQTALLILSPIFFLTLYTVAIFLMKAWVNTKLSTPDLALKFAFSLIPIAVAYNIAHYYTLLLTQGQTIIALISDPFNKGWNLFGTADYSINVGIIGANFVWNSQVLIIVVGHIAAVFIAHFIALQIFSQRKQALISQLPMLILMVIYTVTGLWILSQPLTGGG